MAITQAALLLLLPLISSTVAVDICNVPGTCIGQLVGFAGGISDYYECLELCQETSDCEWFTSNPQTISCDLYSTCSIDVAECPECVSGESGCPAIQCGLTGLCQGTALHSERSPSHIACQKSCTNSVDCSFYSYDYDTQLCRHFDDCSEASTELCPKCASGQPECGVDQFLMVAGGWTQGGKSSLSDVEIVSLREDLPVPECLKNVSPLPMTLQNHAMGLLQPGSTPHVCGGGLSSECYAYSFSSDEWLYSGTLPEAHNGAAFTSSDHIGLVMAGGYFDGGYRTFDGVSYDELPAFPVESHFYNCLTSDGEGMLYLGANYGQVNQLFSLDIDAGDTEWTSLGQIPSSPRPSMSCGVAPNRQGQKEVVLAGGSWDWEVDFYNLETKEWRSSNNSLTTALQSAASVPYGDTFLIVGGYEIHTTDALDTVFEYVPVSESFRLVPGATLKTPRFDHAAVLVDALQFPECK